MCVWVGGGGAAGRAMASGVASKRIVWDGVQYGWGRVYYALTIRRQLAAEIKRR